MPALIGIGVDRKGLPVRLAKAVRELAKVLMPEFPNHGRTVGGPGCRHC